MFSKLLSKLGRIVDPTKAEKATYRQLDDAEKGCTPNKYCDEGVIDRRKGAVLLGIQRNQPLSQGEIGERRKAAVLQKARTKQPLNKSEIENNELPPYSPLQNSSSTFGCHEKQRSNKRQIDNDELPSYHSSETSRSISRCQHIESLIEKRKDEIHLLERQLEEASVKGVHTSTNATLHSGEMKQPNLDFWVKLCSDSSDMMKRDLEKLKEYNGGTNLDKRNEE